MSQLPPPPSNLPPGQAMPYFSPPERSRPKGPWPAWKWGCLIAGALGVLMLGGLTVCCGIPAYRANRMYRSIGMEGLMAMGWLANLAQGKMDQVGQLTVGGRPQADALRQRIEGTVGTVSNFQPKPDDIQAEPNQPAGTAVIRVPVQGSTGSAVCVLRLRNTAQNLWQVEDLTLEPPAQATPSP